MNHCIDCGRQVKDGKSSITENKRNVHCFLCQQARIMETFRYVSPAMKRYYTKKKEYDHHSR